MKEYLKFFGPLDNGYKKYEIIIPCVLDKTALTAKGQYVAIVLADPIEAVLVKNTAGNTTLKLTVAKARRTAGVARPMRAYQTPGKTGMMTCTHARQTYRIMIGSQLVLIDGGGGGGAIGRSVDISINMFARNTFYCNLFVRNQLFDQDS